MTKPNENAIRDFLAERLELVEPGLTLVDREHYLKNAQGAAGFLDIFARDQSGRLVIIEIKRTDAAAREALQELFKYAALIREKYLVRYVEYRLILLAVEWRELGVPYSEFVKSAPFEISAGEITLGEDGWPTNVQPYVPLATALPRRISRRHFLWRFDNDHTASAAIPLIAAHMRKAGLEDFVLILSHSTDERISDKTFLYFAQQELTLDGYRNRIRAQLNDESFEEFEEQIADLVEEEDQIAEAADAVWLPGYDELFHQINSDHSEISHPEKAAKWFSDGVQSDVIIERFGRFIDTNLADETIIREIVGQGGTSDYILRLSAHTGSRPQVIALKEAIENVFFFNSEWRSASLDLLRYAEKTGPSVVEVKAFSNEDILRSIAGAAFGYPGYVPTFSLTIKHQEGEAETFLGLPEWNGTSLNYGKLIETYYGNDPFNYFVSCHFGENRRINADLMSDLGLSYIVFRVVDGIPEKIRIVGSSIVGSPKRVAGSLFGLIDANVDEVHKLVAMFMEHDQGFARVIEDWVNSDLNVARRKIE